MPGLVRNGRKRPSPVELDDSSDSDPPTPISVNGKRARYNHDAPRSAASTEDVFQPGSIVRVKLKNFVTYTAAEFHLGPSLNMIIGPNGTGKSTLVCAICLGLGWSAKLLGRSKELSEYVKHGAAEAEIEIELAKADDMRTNPIITRILRREDNKTVFLLNGKPATKDAIMDICKRFSIQIDNLCQFLPQDRVVEFAKMKDTERLRATLGAAARPEVSMWHEQLKTLRDEEKELEVKRHGDEERLKKLEALQNTTRGDVEIWNQRQELAMKAKTLLKVRPIIELRLRKEEFRKAKEDRRAAEREWNELQAEVEPVQQAEAAAQTYYEQVSAVTQRRKQMMDMVKKQADRKSQAISAEKAAIEDYQAKITSEMRSKQQRQQDVTRSNKKIAELERKRQERPPEYDQAEFQQRKEELRQEGSANERRITDLRAVMSTIQAKIHDYMAQKKAIIAERDKLDTQSGKQSNLLQRLSPDTMRAWEWFQKNKNSLSLEGEVYGPPILTCSITDPRYVDAVESQIRFGDVVAITCTNNDDQRLLLAKMTGKLEEGGMGLHGVYLRTSPRPLSSYQAPVPASNLAQYGFEGYLRDYVTGPDPVIAMLCDNGRLNRVAYAPQSISDEQHAAAARSPIQSWVSGKEVYRIVTRKEYGVSSTSVNYLKRGKWFVDQPVNSDEKAQLDERLQEMTREGNEMNAEHTQAKAEVQDLSEKGRAIKEQREAILADEKQKRKAIAEWEGIPSLIDQAKAELQQCVDLNAQTGDRIREIKAQSRLCSLKIADLTLEYAKSVTEFRRHFENVVEAEIRLIEAASERRALKEENKLILERLAMREAEVKQLKRVTEDMKAELIRTQANLQVSVDSCTPEESAIVLAYKDLASVAELESEIQSVNARIEMMSGGSAQVVKTYENREVQILEMRESLKKHVAALEESQRTIKDIKEPFEKELEELVAKISDAFAHNFSQIGCAGEVSVYKDDDDFNAWSIQISVRFREGESMSILNANRQSGGERAVSTIFYLMALQDLAQAPFRVVDEINQGMDPRNERIVHERMVDIACQERTSQYFLITPKLLTGLKFHKKMTVHVINSGEHVPQSKQRDEWNLRELASVALRVRGRVGAAA